MHEFQRKKHIAVYNARDVVLHTIIKGTQKVVRLRVVVQRCAAASGVRAENTGERGQKVLLARHKVAGVVQVGRHRHGREGLLDDALLGSEATAARATPRRARCQRPPGHRYARRPGLPPRAHLVCGRAEHEGPEVDHVHDRKQKHIQAVRCLEVVKRRQQLHLVAVAPPPPPQQDRRAVNASSRAEHSGPQTGADLACHQLARVDGLSHADADLESNYRELLVVPLDNLSTANTRATTDGPSASLVQTAPAPSAFSYRAEVKAIQVRLGLEHLLRKLVHVRHAR